MVLLTSVVMVCVWYGTIT